MKGILAVNGFLNSEKFSDIYSRLRSAFSERGAELIMAKNSELIHSVGEDVPLSGADFCLFWDKDVLLAKSMENTGLPVFNSARSIELCDDKAKTHLALKDLPAPETIIAPMTFQNIGYTDTSFLKTVAKKLGFPLVVKERCGSFGAQVYLAKNEEELLSLVKEHGREPLIFQKFISESSGRDIRISVVGGRCVAAMLRKSKFGDFRSNVTLGGETLPYSPSDAEVFLAEAAAKTLGLDFCGVDILFGSSGPLLCEVNSNAHFKSTYDCTGIDLAALIAEHIISSVRGEK